MLIEHLSAG